MKTTIEIFTAYRELTENYVEVSQQLRALLPKVTALSKARKLPEPGVLKEMLLDFDKAEEDIEETLYNFRLVRHKLLRLV